MTQEVIKLDEEKDAETLAKWKEGAEKIADPVQASAFMQALIIGYEHDYGTIVHAIYSAMIAAYHAIENSPQGGITGFQASALGWMLIERFFGRSVIGRKLTTYDNMLYPQYASHFQQRISAGMWNKLQENAKVFLAETNPQKEGTGRSGSPEVIAHWQSIVDGVVPFGIQVSPDKENENA